jgi:hypothetical protein
MKKIAKLPKKYILFVFLIILLLATICLFFFTKEFLAKKNDIKSNAQNFTKQCEAVFDFRRCYTPLFKKLANNSSIDDVLNTLKETQLIDPRANNCHYLAHEIVSILIKRYPDAWVKRLNTFDLNWCSTGFLHGTMLKLNLDKGDFQSQVNGMDEFCKNIIAVQPDKRQMDDSCYHATGHVFLIENGGQIDESLKVCELFDTAKKRQDCSIGLFMETVQRDALVEHGLKEKNNWSWEELEKQEALCQKYDTITARACWMEIWPLYKANAWRISKGIGNLNALYNLCGRTGEKKAQDRCYQYGIYTTTDNGLAFLTQSEKEHSCDVYKEDLFRLTECIMYIGTEFIRSNAVKETSTVSAVCSNAVSPDQKNCCRFFVGNNKSQLQSAVATIEDNFEACMLDGGKIKKYHEL